MPELMPSELLQPSLLDRLTDEEPGKTSESRERRVLSMRQLRAGVLRDLAWLLNTGNLETTDDLSDYPLAADSVLNYGMPDLTGKAASGLDAAELERRVRQAIHRYEPRLLPRSLNVRVQVDRESARPNSLLFEIEAELWATPVPENLFIKTELDLETGALRVGAAEGRP